MWAGYWGKIALSDALTETEKETAEQLARNRACSMKQLAR